MSVNIRVAVPAKTFETTLVCAVQPNLVRKLIAFLEGSALATAYATEIALIEAARVAGYRAMRLDTVPGHHDAAIGLYRKFGFVDIEPRGGRLVAARDVAIEFDFVYFRD